MEKHYRSQLSNVKPNSTAKILSTYDEVQAFNTFYDRDVRTDLVDGTYILIKAATNQHIGILSTEYGSRLSAAVTQLAAEPAVQPPGGGGPDPFSR